MKSTYFFLQFSISLAIGLCKWKEKQIALLKTHSIAYKNPLNMSKKETTEKFTSLSGKALLKKTNLLVNRKRNSDLKWIIITTMTCHDYLLKWILSPEELNYVVWMLLRTLTARVVLKKKGGLKWMTMIFFCFCFWSVDI